MDSYTLDITTIKETQNENRKRKQSTSNKPNQVLISPIHHSIGSKMPTTSIDKKEGKGLVSPHSQKQLQITGDTVVTLNEKQSHKQEEKPPKTTPNEKPMTQQPSKLSPSLKATIQNQQAEEFSSKLLSVLETTVPVIRDINMSLEQCSTPIVILKLRNNSKQQWKKLTFFNYTIFGESYVRPKWNL